LAKKSRFAGHVRTSDEPEIRSAFIAKAAIIGDEFFSAGASRRHLNNGMATALYVKGDGTVDARPVIIILNGEFCKR